MAMWYVIWDLHVDPGVGQFYWGLCGGLLEWLMAVLLCIIMWGGVWCIIYIPQHVTKHHYCSTSAGQMASRDMQNQRPLLTLSQLNEDWPGVGVGRREEGSAHWYWIRDLSLAQRHPSPQPHTSIKSNILQPVGGGRGLWLVDGVSCVSTLSYHKLLSFCLVLTPPMATLSFLSPPHAIPCNINLTLLENLIWWWICPLHCSNVCVE